MHADFMLALDLDMLGTRPDYHRKGLGSMLLKWGLEKADRDRLEVYISASPQGRPLYERYGCVLFDNEEVYPGMMQGYLLRPAKSG